MSQKLSDIWGAKDVCPIQEALEKEKRLEIEQLAATLERGVFEEKMHLYNQIETFFNSEPHCNHDLDFMCQIADCTEAEMDHLIQEKVDSFDLKRLQQMVKKIRGYERALEQREQWLKDKITVGTMNTTVSMVNVVTGSYEYTSNDR